MKVGEWNDLAVGGSSRLFEIRDGRCWRRIALEVSRSPNSNLFVVRLPSVYAIEGGRVLPLNDDVEAILMALLPEWDFPASSSLETARRLALERLKAHLRAFDAGQWLGEIAATRALTLSKVASVESALNEAEYLVLILRAFREKVEEIPDV